MTLCPEILSRYRDDAIISRLEKVERTFIPSIAVGELHYGARRSARTKENMEQIERLVATGVVLTCDGETGYWYGFVKDKLGKPEAGV